MKEKIKEALLVVAMAGFFAWLIIGYLSEPIENMQAPENTTVVSVVE